MKKCDICGNNFDENKKSCAPCQEIISRYDELPKSKLRPALHSAYDSERSKGEERYFRCQYTGISGQFNPTAKSDLDPIKDALTITIDHVNPKDWDSDLVVSLHIINAMKSKLSEEEFRRITIALGRFFSKAIEQEDFEKEFRGILQRG